MGRAKNNGENCTMNHIVETLFWWPNLKKKISEAKKLKTKKKWEGTCDNI